MYAELVKRLREYAGQKWAGVDSRFAEDLRAAADALEAMGGARKEDYTKLRAGDPIWYADFESGQIEAGTISSIYFKDGAVDSFSVDFACGDFDEFIGSALGDNFFMKEENATRALLNGKASK